MPGGLATMTQQSEDQITADLLHERSQAVPPRGALQSCAGAPPPWAAPLIATYGVAGPMGDRSPMHQARSDVMQHAVSLARLTVVWMLLEAASALCAGLQAQSLTLIAFGVESGLKLLAASVLLWRLAREGQHGRAFSARAAQYAGEMRGVLLLTLVLSITISAARGLWVHHRAALSLFGLILTLGAVPILGWLATAKLRLAAAIGSRALRTDAFESLTCGCLAGVVILGLGTAWVWHVWWIDNVTVLVLVYCITLQHYLIIYLV